MISAIAAVDYNWGIGYNGQLLEHISADLKRFKELTNGHTVIMGRKTWESLPKKPLENRINLIITHQEHKIESMAEFISLEEAKARIINKDDKYFIIGGGLIYKEFLPLCDKVYLTKIHKNYEKVDTFFPNLDKDCHWFIKSASEIIPHKDFSYQFLEYKKSQLIGKIKKFLI